MFVYWSRLMAQSLSIACIGQHPGTHPRVAFRNRFGSMTAWSHRRTRWSTRHRPRSAAVSATPTVTNHMCVNACMVVCSHDTCVTVTYQVNVKSLGMISWLWSETSWEQSFVYIKANFNMLFSSTHLLYMITVTFSFSFLVLKVS